MTGVLKVDDIQDAGANSIVSSNGSGTLTFGNFTAATITASTALVPDASDGAALGTTALEWSDLFLADGAVINFGDDQEVTLTHVADTGLLISSTDQLQFGDSGTYIHQSADGVLDLVSDTEIELNATTLDINANVEISGTAVTTGVHTFTAVPVFPNNTVETADIQADAITGAKIADDAINSEHYTDGSIDTAHLADGQVTVGKLATAVFTGATDIGAAIVDADLFLMDDGAGGTIRKTTAARLKTYIPGVGKVLQVVNTGSSTETSSSSTTYADSSLTAAITPSASSSKVLVMITQAGLLKNSSDNGGKLRLLRGSTALEEFENDFGRNGGTGLNIVGGASCNVLDSPNTTSETTYKTQVACSVSSNASVAVQHNSAFSTIILMEIGA